MFKESKPKIIDAKTIIGQGAMAEGNFVGEENVIVRGQIKGIIEIKNDLGIEEGAVVKADIKAKNVFLAGEIRGGVKVEERISLDSSARLLGNIDCKFLSVEDGAVFNGKCHMGDQST